MAIGKCAYTGEPISDPGDGIWDDGEWISWDYISQVQYQQELKSEFPNADPAVVEIFRDIVGGARDYWELTNRHLDIFGELGELYAEIRYGLQRHKANAQGSDGRIGNDYVEVKTISPGKSRESVNVKREGHFNKLVVVKIDENYEFESRMIDRRMLKEENGRFAAVNLGELGPEE